MSWGSQYDAARDGLVALLTGLGAQALVSHSITGAARDAASDLAIYVVLAMIGALWRAAWNARDGRMPSGGTLLRALLISLGVGLVGGLLIIDLNWSPFVKMALIVLLSFGADWSIPAAQAALRGWLSRMLAPQPPQRNATAARKRVDEPSEGG